jgi:hypothetical protein
MHGHRHIDWIGACGAIKIVSAPSPVMGAADDAPSYVTGRSILIHGARIPARSETKLHCHHSRNRIVEASA